jgi:tetratricopeptide (TPR) repeat protein
VAVPSPRVFISFSSADRDFVRRLFYSLRGQGAAVWDYTRRGDEITPGASVPAVLRDHIDASDCFLTVVSKSSTAPDTGSFVRLELEHALARGMLGQGRILPVVLVDRPPADWTGSFARLRTAMYLEVKTADERGYDDLMVRICRFLGIPYSPPFLGDLRLPFAEQFRKEMREVITTPAVYDELAVVVDEFARRFKAREWPEAEETVSYLLLAARNKMPGTELYYPQIARAVCQMQLGRFAEAEELLLVATRHPRHDENSYGALGQSYFRQQRYDEALVAYSKALELCPNDERLELRFDMLGTRIQLDQPIVDKEVLDQFDRKQLDPAELADVEKMDGIVRYKLGAYKEALAVFDRMRKERRDDAAVATYGFLCYVQTGSRPDALKRLRADAERLGDTTVYHYLAFYSLLFGEFEAGLDVYRRFLCVPGRRTRRYMMEYASALAALGQVSESRRVCHDVLSRACFRRPSTAEEFYLDGLANYLLGNRERARYDFERSDGFRKKYYDELKPGQVDDP